jgi:hypothetical protein
MVRRIWKQNIAYIKNANRALNRQKGGEQSEDSFKKHYRMYGIELYVTRGRSLVLVESHAQEKSAAP